MVAVPAWLSFRRCGVAGLLCACAVALGLAAATGRSVAVQAGLIAAAVATFLALALVTKALLGREALIYYHHEIAVLGVTAGVAALLGAPVLAHLDFTAAGLGAFLACGRVGCAAAGCCHGRPARRRGLVYREEIAPHLMGVPLVPVQLWEAAVALALSATAAALVLGGAAAGAAAVLYVEAYAVARFALEGARGDALRPHWRGLSEARWTSLALAPLTAAAALAGLVPGGPAPLVPALGLALAAVLVARRRPALLDPAHIRELERVLRRPRGVARTSAGLQVSAGTTAGVSHYALSVPGRALVRGEVAALARVILALRHRGTDGELVDGPAGVWHLVVR